MAFGCANYKVYAYDLRSPGQALGAIAGPQRAVSYVRFMGGSHLVAASTDSTIRSVACPCHGVLRAACCTWCCLTGLSVFLVRVVVVRGFGFFKVHEGSQRVRTSEGL